MIQQPPYGCDTAPNTSQVGVEQDSTHKEITTLVTKPETGQALTSIGSTGSEYTTKKVYQ